MNSHVAFRAACLFCLFVSCSASAGPSVSEAEVLKRYGTLDVPAEVLAEMSAAIEAERTPARGVSSIRYAGPGCEFETIRAAIVASAAGDTVRVVTGTYDERVIVDQDVDIIGGFADCSATTPTGRSTIDRGGSGLGLDVFYPAAVGDPVRAITIENFVITGGGGTGFASGGVIVEGRPGRLAVSFRNVEVSNNVRSGANGDGGGVRIISTGDSAGFGAMVTFDNQSTIVNNTAGGNGGGVHCRSSFDAGFVTMLRIGTTLVFGNQATNGGGIASEGCDRVFLYSGGPVLFIVPTGGLVDNTATGDGGAIWVSDGGSVQLRADAFDGFGDSDEAALMAANSAGFRGGAVAVQGTDSSVRVIDAYTINNNAAQGAGFWATDNVGLTVEASSGRGRCEAPFSDAGLLRRPPCSVIDGNDASSGGGAFAVTQQAMAAVYRTIIRNNTAGGGLGPIARVTNDEAYDGPQARLRIEGSVIHDNSGGFGFYAFQNSEIIISHSTVADNPIVEFRSSASSGRLAAIRLLSSIVDGGSFAFGSTSGDGVTVVEFDCVIGSAPPDGTGATSTFNYSQIDPEFVDQDARDYRLGATSPAIDYCSDINPADRPGLDGNPRGQVWTGPAPNAAPNPGDGPYDLGAFEIPFSISDTDLAIRTEPGGLGEIFIDSGESIDLTLVVSNQSQNPAYGPIEIIDQFTSGAVVNQSWSCAPPPGVSCTPGSGTGGITTTLSGVDPGDQVFIFVDADPAQPTQDQDFQYTALVVESEFNVDTSPGSNTVLVDVKSGLFSDGFE